MTCSLRQRAAPPEATPSAFKLNPPEGGGFRLRAMYPGTTNGEGAIAALMCLPDQLKGQSSPIFRGVLLAPRTAFS
jgi:hypothetical protein